MDLLFLLPLPKLARLFAPSWAVLFRLGNNPNLSRAKKAARKAKTKMVSELLRLVYKHLDGGRALLDYPHGAVHK